MGATLLDHALSYAAHGFPVCPLHTPLSDGACDCHDRACTSPGKHPRTAHGLTDASTDEAMLRRWWLQWPRANIGLPLPHGWAAVDIDDDGGYTALSQAGHDLPPTAVSETGRGHHYMYRTVCPVPPKVGLLPHVDLRGPGSYIVAPPSLHFSGHRYRWVIPLREASAAPAWLEAVTKRGDGATRARFDTGAALAGVPAGQRDVTLFRLAAKLRRADVPRDIAERLVLEAAANCAPPFPPAVALDKVGSAYTAYAPAPLRQPVRPVWEVYAE